MSVSKEKVALRRAATARRAEAAEAAPRAGEALAAYAGRLPPAAVVSAYVPMRSEIDPMPLARALEARGAMVALPAIVDGAMVFRLWRSGNALVPGTFGTFEPEGEAVTPGLLIVPLLAFTRQGLRLGYGGGFYDKWLAAHPGVPAYGVAYAAQEVAELPGEPHDEPLTGIVTEKELIVTGERACG
jgi:5-formyltetrahydrofolate cyclo-ligase